MDRILTLFSQAWLCLLAVGASAQVSFTSYPAPACGDPTISISSADNRNSVDTADTKVREVFTITEKAHTRVSRCEIETLVRKDHKGQGG